jgi:hypothetical protein
VEEISVKMALRGKCLKSLFLTLVDVEMLIVWNEFFAHVMLTVIVSLSYSLLAEIPGVARDSR